MERVSIRLQDLANPAGALTMARFPLALVFALLQTGPWALAVYLAGVGTDVVDGWIARRTGTTSAAGALADGIADKTFHAAVALSLWSAGAIPWHWLLLWFSREAGQALLMGGMLLARHEHASPHRKREANRLGKATTVVLGLACIAVLAGWSTLAIAATHTCGVIGLVATLSYARRELG